MQHPEYTAHSKIYKRWEDFDRNVTHKCLKVVNWKINKDDKDRLKINEKTKEELDFTAFMEGYNKAVEQVFPQYFHVSKLKRTITHAHTQNSPVVVRGINGNAPKSKDIQEIISAKTKQ